MSKPPLFVGLLLISVVALGGSPETVGDESANLNQLQAMPRERRLALLENLERFDKLDPTEQAAIRKLDAEIARKDPVERARYRALLRRYHLWVNGLTEDQKTQLKAAEGTDERFNLVRKFRLKELGEASTSPKVFGIRTGDYGVNGPYETAHLLRVWAKLTAAKKAEIARLQSRSQIFKEIQKAVQKRDVVVPFQAFPAAEERHYDDILENYKDFKSQVGSSLRRVDVLPKRAEPLAKGEVAPKRYELRLTEFLYFEANKPKPVSQVNLERFSNACPAWLHEILDPLSPDDARNYLTIIYRLLYPDPDEMPDEVKPAKAASSPPSSPKPGTTKPAANSPF